MRKIGQSIESYQKDVGCVFNKINRIIDGSNEDLSAKELRLAIELGMLTPRKK